MVVLDGYHRAVMSGESSGLTNAEEESEDRLQQQLSQAEYDSLMQRAEHTFLRWYEVYRLLLSVEALDLPVRSSPVENPLSEFLLSFQLTAHPSTM